MSESEKTSEAADDVEIERRQLVQTVYDDLRKLASRQMASQNPGHTLTATALVNEVSLRLLSDNGIPPQDRSQFLAYASRAMRNMLIDHARSKGRQKRGGDHKLFSFHEAVVAANEQSEELLQLHDALERLAVLLPRKAQVVEMRYFGGMQLSEVAEALEISVATVKRDWEVAKTMLLQELQQETGD